MLSGSPLIYLRDKLSGSLFLVDTGAEWSLLPHQSSSPSSGPQLQGAASCPIASWGFKQVDLLFGSDNVSFNFLLAGVTRPILGIDFLSAHGLLAEPARRRVLKATDLAIIGGSKNGGNSGLIAHLSTVDPEVRKLLSASPAALSVNNMPGGRALHGVSHPIETTGRPVFAKACCLDSEKLAQAKEEFTALEKAGIIRQSDSQWASPLHMVRK